MLIYHLSLEMYHLGYKSYGIKNKVMPDPAAHSSLVSLSVCLSLSLSLSLSHSLLPFILRVPLDPAGARP